QLALLMICAGTSAAQQAGSLMVNGGFESGTGAVPDGWNASLYPGQEPPGQCATRSSECVRSGQWSLKIDTGPILGRDLVIVFNGAVSKAAHEMRRQRLELSGWVYVQPGTVLRPIHMRLRTFGPDEKGQNAFLGDVLETTVLGNPGQWVEFRASGRVPDKVIQGMDLHCSIGADVVRTVQFLDDIVLAAPAPKPFAIRVLCSSMWRDQQSIPVAVEVGAGQSEGAARLDFSLRDGKKEVASWHKVPRSGILALSLPPRLLPEGRYLVQASLRGADGRELVSARAPIELVASPWEEAPKKQPAVKQTTGQVTAPAFAACGTVAPTDAADEVPSEAEPVSEDVLLAQWQERGYAVFCRHWLDLPSRLGRPRPGETGPIRVFASPGEYEPAAVSVWALKALRNVSIKVGPIAGEGYVIPPGCVDVRTVRNLRNLPAFLERRPSVDVEANQTQTFWLTIYVPPNAKPGFYYGTVRVSAEGRQPTDVQLLLRVLPLKLPPPQKGYGFWWAMDGRWKGYYSDERSACLEQIRKQFVLLREYGCNMVACYVLPKITRNPDGSFSYDFTQDHWKHCVYSMDDFFRIGRETRFLSPQHPIQYPGAEALHSSWIAREFGFNRESPEFDAFYREACRAIDRWVKDRGYVLAFACVDEIGNGVDRQREALRFYRLAQEAGVLTSVTDNSMHGGVHLMGQQRFDEIIAMRLYNFIVPEMIEHARASGDRLWLYNVGSAGWWAKLDRFVFGFFTERCGAEGCAQWAFQWPRGQGGPYRASEAGEPTGWQYALPDPDGPLPTVALEG
ncbi:MAG: hypothetical protein H5T86_13130, partial [Armatimonadetes bacterium]|nr:hypothetical protein [Armatimonadota bacterium]